MEPDSLVVARLMYEALEPDPTCAAPEGSSERDGPVEVLWERALLRAPLVNGALGTVGNELLVWRPWNISFVDMETGRTREGPSENFPDFMYAAPDGSIYFHGLGFYKRAPEGGSWERWIEGQFYTQPIVLKGGDLILFRMNRRIERYALADDAGHSWMQGYRLVWAQPWADRGTHFRALYVPAFGIVVAGEAPDGRASRIAAFHVDNGHVVWTLEQHLSSDAVSFGAKHYVGMTTVPNGLTVLSAIEVRHALTGDLLAKRVVGNLAGYVSWLVTSPEHNRVYLQHETYAPKRIRLLAFDGDLRFLWGRDLPGPYAVPEWWLEEMGRPAVDDQGNIVVGARNCTVYAFDKHGTLLWFDRGKQPLAETDLLWDHGRFIATFAYTAGERMITAVRGYAATDGAPPACSHGECPVAVSEAAIAP